MHDSAWSVSDIFFIFVGMKTNQESLSKKGNNLDAKRHAEAMRYTEQFLEQLVLKERAILSDKQTKDEAAEADKIVEIINKMDVRGR